MLLLDFAEVKHFRVQWAILQFTLQDNQLIEAAKDILNGASKHLRLDVPVMNMDRAFGTTLSYHIAK